MAKRMSRGFFMGSEENSEVYACAVRIQTHMKLHGILTCNRCQSTLNPYSPKFCSICHPSKILLVLFLVNLCIHVISLAYQDLSHTCAVLSTIS